MDKDIIEHRIAQLRIKLANVDNNYDYYDDSNATRNTKESERRCVEMQIDTLKAILEAFK